MNLTPRSWLKMLSLRTAVTGGRQMWITGWMLLNLERCTADAELLCETDPAAAIRTLQKAVALYVGTYLPECSYQEWVVPTAATITTST